MDAYVGCISNLIDVFNIQPQAVSRGEGSSKALRSDVRPQSQTQSPMEATGESSTNDVRLRTIRRGHAGPVFTTLDRGAIVSKAVQEAIG